MLRIVSKKTWRTCDFPVWERVKHIVPVYNAHPSYKIKNLGKKTAHYATLNTVKTIHRGKNQLVFFQALVLPSFNDNSFLK